MSLKSSSRGPVGSLYDKSQRKSVFLTTNSSGYGEGRGYSDLIFTRPLGGEEKQSSVKKEERS